MASKLSEVSIFRLPALILSLLRSFLGSYGNVIADNVIHDTAYPGIFVYGAPGRVQNLVERNVIWNTGAAGIQITGSSASSRKQTYLTLFR